jgi:surface antigen
MITSGNISERKWLLADALASGTTNSCRLVYQLLQAETNQADRAGMKSYQLAFSLALLLTASVPAQARSAFAAHGDSGGSAGELAPYIQCVPYAREVTGIRIYGDAHTWWEQAEGRYRRGHRPKPGAVMAFAPHGNMRLGHVAAVTRIIDSRTLLLSHANWSPIDGSLGQVERNVTAIDVSPGNDWSEVRVWYDPLQGLGTTHWPLHGFIYNEGLSVPAAAAPSPGARTAAAPAGRSGDPIADIISGRYR